MPLLRKRIHFWLAGTLGRVLLRGLSATWRVRYVIPEGLRACVASGQEPIIATFWHRQLLSMLCACWDYPFRDYPFCAPVSEHRDGEYVAWVMERCGLLAVRGSTTRGATRLLRNVLEAIGEGWSCALTPDGPRGPKFSVQPGFLLLARRTGLPVYPIGVAVDRAWVLNTWEDFVIPKLGTRISIVTGRPFLPQDLVGRPTGELCAELREKIMDATERARENLAGRRAGT